jgi:PAS domain S-box-containing protein
MMNNANSDTQRLQQVNRMYRTISHCDHHLIRAEDEDTLAQNFCSVMVEEGGYRMAWVGYAQNDEARSIRPIAYAGLESGYLENLNLTWADTDRGSGPGARCIREQTVQVTRDIANDPRFVLWREEAATRGYASSIALPLTIGTGTLGFLGMYSERGDAFDEEEIGLLTEAADDLAYGITALRNRRERKELADALEEAARFNRATLDGLTAHIAILDDEGAIIAVNKPWEDFATANGPASGTVSIGANYLAVCDRSTGLHSEESTAVAAGIRAVLGSVIPQFASEYPCHSPSEQRWFIVRVTPFPGQEHRRAIVAHEDITERKQATEAVREREELVQLLLDSTAEAIYGIDLHGNCMLANATCTRLLGYAAPEQLKGRNMHALIHHHHSDGRPYPEEECPIVRAMHSGQGIHEAEVFWRADGTKLDAEYFSYPMWRDKELVGAVVTFLDLSQQKKLEEQLRQAQKMDAFGQLAGGVAHDFNNLLTVISGYSELLLQSAPPDDPSRELLEEIRKAGERAGSLTRQLLAFSRKQVLAPKVLDVNDVVRDTEKMLHRVIGEDIRLTATLHPQLGSVTADQGQLEQIILNLAVNARDAMPQGGRLTIETSNVVFDQDYAMFHADVRPGSYVMLAVTDTGIGMTGEVRRRVFEPFFTTKGTGKGTGLGLAVVHGIVKQSDGTIEVYSEPGRGTSFKIYLPRVEQAATSGKSRADLGPPPRGTETLLLVEDEDAVRALARFTLQQCGYTVLEASHGEEAISVATKHREKIHMLVTDVVMPGLGGRVLAEQLLGLHPEMKVLYLSGYTDDAIVRHGILHEQVNFLQKPFSPNALAHQVREVLAE